MIIYGRPISAHRIAKSLLAAVVVLALLWAALAICEPVEQAVIDYKKLPTGDVE